MSDSGKELLTLKKRHVRPGPHVRNSNGPFLGRISVFTNFGFWFLVVLYKTGSRFTYDSLPSRQTRYLYQHLTKIEFLLIISSGDY